MEAINRSRQKIADNIRKATMADGLNCGLPQLSLINTKNHTKEDNYDRFSESLKIAGAEVVMLKHSELDDYINKKFLGAIDFRSMSVWDSYKRIQPVELAARTECVLLCGKMGVAENGAIWVDDTCFPERLLPFIAGKLILLVDCNTIVSDMHAAYASIASKLEGFGVFISGPSKTADIEQSLVYGAHGAISVDVIILKG
ncbi:MAG: LUD domain-containing protein [Rikenellaceae bacterium]|nr:LUD domain-containing protein [Rikenellaceae bacterium]